MAVVVGKKSDDGVLAVVVVVDVDDVAVEVDGVADVAVEVDEVVDEVSVAVEDVEEVVIDIEPATETKETFVAPDGGFGWVVLAACFVISFLSAGYTRAFLAAVLKEFSSSGLGDASWIKAAPTSFPLLLAPLTGMFLERFGHRATVAIGFFLCGLAMSVGSFAVSVGPATSTLSVFLGLGLALANTSTLDCLKKHFTSKRPLVLAINRVGGLFGGLISPVWVELLIGVVGFSGTWLVWSGMFVAILVLGLVVFGNPEDHFVSVMKEVPVADTPRVEREEVVESANIFVRFLRSLMGKLGFSFLLDVRFALVVAISVTMGLGNSCFTGSAAKRAKDIELGDDLKGMLPILATSGEIVATIVYGILARRSPIPRFGEYSAALVLVTICAGFPYLCGAFWLLAIFATISGMANAVLKAVPVLILIENHGVGNLVGTLNVVKMFDGITKILYPHVASPMGIGAVAYFNAGAVGFSAVLGLSLSWVCYRL